MRKRVVSAAVKKICFGDDNAGTADPRGTSSCRLSLDAVVDEAARIAGGVNETSGKPRSPKTITNKCFCPTAKRCGINDATAVASNCTQCAGGMYRFGYPNAKKWSNWAAVSATGGACTAAATLYGGGNPGTAEKAECECRPMYCPDVEGGNPPSRPLSNGKNGNPFYSAQGVRDSTAERESRHALFVVARCYNDRITVRGKEYSKQELSSHALVFDVIGSLILLLAVAWLRLKERAEVRMIRNRTVTAADYTVELVQLPANQNYDTLADELKDHLEHVLNQPVSDVRGAAKHRVKRVDVASVHFAMSNGEILSVERKREKLCAAARRLRALKNRIAREGEAIADGVAPTGHGAPGAAHPSSAHARGFAGPTGRLRAAALPLHSPNLAQRSSAPGGKHVLHGGKERHLDVVAAHMRIERKRKRCEKKLRKIQARLVKADRRILAKLTQHERAKSGEGLVATRAFVTFEQEEGKIRCVDRMPDSLQMRWFGSCLQPQYLRFTHNGEYVLRFKAAPPPSAIIWENLAHGKLERLLRALVANIVATVLCVLSVLLVFKLMEKQRSFQSTYESSTVSCADTPPSRYDVQLGFLKNNNTASEAVNCFCDAAVSNPSLYSLNAIAKFYLAEDCNSQTSCAFNTTNGTSRLWLGGIAEPAANTAERQKLDDFQYEGATVSLCVEYLASLATIQTLIFTSIFLTLFVNTLLDQLLRRLVKHEKHASITSEQRAITRKVFAAQFINTAVITLTVQGNLERVSSNPGALRPLFQGQHSDFSADWYKNVGSGLVLTMMFNIFAPHTWPLYRVGLQRFRIWRDRGFDWSAKHISRQLTQDDLEDMYSGPPFQIATRYGQMLNTIFVTLLFSPGLPLLWWTAAATFFVSYWVDKFLFCRYYSTPPLYDESASRVVTGLLPWAVLGHFAVGFWMWSYELLVPQSSNSLGATTQALGSPSIGVDEMDELVVGPAGLLLSGSSQGASSGMSLTWTADYFNKRVSESSFAKPYLFCTSMLGLFLALKLFLFDEGSAFMRLLCPCLCRKVDVNASSARASGALGGQKALPPLTHALPRSVLKVREEAAGGGAVLRVALQPRARQLARPSAHPPVFTTPLFSFHLPLKDLADGPRTAKALRLRATAALEELQEGKRSWPGYVEFRKKCAFADLRSYDMRDNPQYDYVGHSNLRTLKRLLLDEVSHNDVKLPGVVAGELYVAGITDDGRQVRCCLPRVGCVGTAIVVAPTCRVCCAGTMCEQHSKVVALTSLLPSSAFCCFGLVCCSVRHGRRLRGLARRQINELTEGSQAVPNKAMGGFDSFFDADGKAKTDGGHESGAGMPTVSSIKEMEGGASSMPQQQASDMSFYSKKKVSCASPSCSALLFSLTSVFPTSALPSGRLCAYPTQGTHAEHVSACERGQAAPRHRPRAQGGR